jgi:hypothetical protein
MSKIVVDILKMELEQKLPYWLSPEGKNSHRADEIRAKHRAAYFAKPKAERRTIKRQAPTAR